MKMKLRMHYKVSWLHVPGAIGAELVVAAIKHYGDVCSIVPMTMQLVGYGVAGYVGSCMHAVEWLQSDTLSMPQHARSFNDFAKDIDCSQRPVYRLPAFANVTR
jgi:hypothetical protein